MTLKSYARFEEKLTSGLENDMRNLANFHQNIESLKMQNMTMQNDAKLEKELTCQFKIDMRNLTNFH